MLLSNMERSVEVDNRMVSESKSGLETPQVVLSKRSSVTLVRPIPLGDDELW